MDKYGPHGAPFIAVGPAVVRLFHGAYSVRAAIFKPFRRASTSPQIILMKLLLPDVHNLRAALSAFLRNF
jgi:hypothetical protein